MDETFDLIETVEKAAQIYMLTAHLPRINTIRDDQMVGTGAVLWREVTEGFSELVRFKGIQKCWKSSGVGKLHQWGN